MLEIIKEQFTSGKALSQSKYYNAVKREMWPKFYWDLYPLAQEYYHELNPYFLFNIYRPDFYRFTKVFTVRDGYVPFASFILTNFNTFAKLEAGQFLVHPDLARLVPTNINSQFGCWQIVQKKQIELSQARKVIVFGFVSDQYLGNMDDLKERLKELKNISSDAEIELYLPIRKNVFELHGKESLTIHLLMDYIKDILPGRKLKILTSEHFFDITNFKNTYVYDLAADNFIVSDNYLHYYVQSRGATVNNKSLTKAPEGSMFSLDLSLHHELHVCPLKKDKNFFTDLLFYKKENPGIKDLTFDPVLQSMLRESFKK
jgi:hypothetical protein